MPPLPSLSPLFCLLALLIPIPVLSQFIPTFRDVTLSAGLSQTPWSKYGGPVVADLDSDGHYDLILTVHKGQRYKIFFGTAAGTFINSGFNDGGDVHGVSVAPRTATSNEKLIFMPVGGRGGKVSRAPRVLLTKPDRSITQVSNQFGFGRGLRRGRIAFFMDLALKRSKGKRKNLGGPDLLIANYLGPRPIAIDRMQIAFANKKGMFEEREVPGFGKEIQGRADVTDVDGDGRMELLSFQEFRVYKLVAPFRFEEAGEMVAPGVVESVQDFTVNAVVEFDMDNDGDFDLYLARGFQEVASNRKNNLTDVAFEDMLLENRNGRYVDVTEGSGIPGKTRSLGVSAEDVNNDGFVDLIVTMFEGPDVLLLNKGDGTFLQTNPGIPKGFAERGDNTLAVDYDQDGRVDLISGQGEVDSRDSRGIFRLMRNEMFLTASRQYLHVRVGNDPSLSCTALHALVTVFVKGGKMVRRVGSRGSQKQGGGSFLDTVHFGLGAAKVKSLTVRWACGKQVKVKQVSPNQLIEVGNFPQQMNSTSRHSA